MPRTSTSAVFKETEGIRDEYEKNSNELRNLTSAPPLATNEEARKQHEQQVKALRDKMTGLEDRYRTERRKIEERQHEEFCRMAKEKIQTHAGQAAAIFAANRDYDAAATTLLSDPIGARNRLDRAAELLEAVRDNTDDKLLKQRAKFQLARVYETRLRRDDQHQDSDNVALARREYEDLANQSPPSYCKAEAERRLAGLQPRAERSRIAKDPVYQWVSDELDKPTAPSSPFSHGSIGSEPPSDPK